MSQFYENKIIEIKNKLTPYIFNTELYDSNRTNFDKNFNRSNKILITLFMKIKKSLRDEISHNHANINKAIQDKEREIMSSVPILETDKFKKENEKMIRDEKEKVKEDMIIDITNTVLQRYGQNDNMKLFTMHRHAFFAIMNMKKIDVSNIQFYVKNSDDLEQICNIKEIDLETITEIYLFKNNTSQFNHEDQLKNIMKLTGLRKIFLMFGHGSNIPLDFLKNCTKLEHISFHKRINQSIDILYNFKDTLKSITFGDNFNKSIDILKYFVNLEYIKLGARFKFSLLPLLYCTKLIKLSLHITFIRNHMTQYFKFIDLVKPHFDITNEYNNKIYTGIDKHVNPFTTENINYSDIIIVVSPFFENITDQDMIEIRNNAYNTGEVGESKYKYLKYKNKYLNLRSKN